MRPPIANPLRGLFERMLSPKAVALATCLGAIAGAGSAVAQGSALTPVKVQSYPGLVASGQPVVWVMVEKGFCRAQGLDCQLVEIAAGPLGLQALAAGSIQFGYATTDTAMQAAARGNDIQLIASTHPNRYFTLSVRKDVPLPNLAKGYPEVMKDLKGLKVRVTGRGSGTEIQTRALLVGAGMSPEDMTFVAVGSTGTSYPAMLSKKIDAAMMFEPFPTLCKVLDTCVNVVPPSQGPDELNSLNGAVQHFSATRKFVQANPKVVDAFILAVQDAVKWMQQPENLDELVSISRKYFSLGDIPNADTAIRMLLQSEQKAVGATLDRKAVQAHADFLLARKLIDKPFDVRNFVYEKAPAP